MEARDGSIWQETRRRRLIPLMAGYFGVGWAGVEVVGFMVARYGWPDRMIDLWFSAIWLGIPLALLLLWKVGAPGPARFASRDLGTFALAVLFLCGGLYLRHRDLAVPVAAVAEVSAPAPDQAVAHHERISQVAIFPFAVGEGAENAWLADGLPVLAEYDLSFDPRFAAVAASSGGTNGLLSVVQRHGARDLATAPLAVRRRAAISHGYRALVTGTISATEAGYRLEVELHRLQPDEALGPFTLQARDPWDAVDQLAATIRRELAPRKAVAEGNDPALKSITSESLQAIQAYVRGRLQVAQADFAGAAQSFGAAESADPTFVMAVYLRMMTPVPNRDPAAMWAELDALLPRLEALPPAFRFQLQRFLARNRGKDGDERRVLEAWSAALPWDRTPAYALAELALQDDPDDAAALERLKEIALSSGSAAEMAGQSANLKRRGRLDEALQLVRLARELDPTDYGSVLRLAEILKARGDLEAAAEQLASAAVLRPDLVSGPIAAAQLAFDRGDWESAVAQLDAIDQRTRERPEQRVGLLQAKIAVLLSLGRLRAAEGLIDELLALRERTTSPIMAPALRASYVEFKYHLHGEAGARAWSEQALAAAQAPMDVYLRALFDGALAVAMRDGDRLEAARLQIVAASQALGQANAADAVSHWAAFAIAWRRSPPSRLAQLQEELQRFGREVRAGKQTEDNLRSLQTLVIERGLQDGDAAGVQELIDALLRSAPGHPELLLQSARRHRALGNTEQARAELARVLAAWAGADAQFELLAQARELQQQL